MHEPSTIAEPIGAVTAGIAGPRPVDANLTLDRMLVAQRAKARLFGRPMPALRVGRYVVLDRLGAGGMGMVFAAFDETLDRRIALKFVHAEYADDPVMRQRFLDEARAMARLSHANVLQIHEVGESDGRLFLALELVEGMTLRKWLDDATPTWREIVAAFRAAGEGLVAAHGAGLVHRDFKPENVLRTSAGVLKVADFGLAGLVATDVGDAEDVTLDGTTAPLPRAMGTPRYMAPEQQRGEADARSDQFSFCVALFEALYRVPPFEGDTPLSIMVAVDEGRRRVVVDRRVPQAIRRVVDRGLAIDPAARWPDMRAMLDALDKTSRSRTSWLGLAAAVAIIVGVLPGRRDEALIVDPCADAGVESRVLEGESLARFASAWSAARREGCEVHKGGGMSADLFDRRQLCLDGALAAVMASRALDLAGVPVPELDTIAACTDPVRLTSGAPTPTAGAERTSWIEVREELARADALLGAARRADAGAVLARIDARDDVDAGARAEAMMLRADLARADADYDRSVRTYLDAASLADLVRNDDLRARAAIDAVWVLGVDLLRADEARRTASQATGALGRTTARPALVASLHEALGMTAMAAGELDLAARELGTALSFAADDRQRAVLHANLASVQLGRGDIDAGVVELRAALAVHEASATPDEITIGKLLNNLGVALGMARRHAEALEIHRRSQVLRERLFGAEALETANALNGIGIALVELGRPGEAVPVLARSLAIRDNSGGSLADLAECRFALARALLETDRARAINLATAARDDYRAPQIAAAHPTEAAAIAAWLTTHGAGRTP